MPDLSISTTAVTEERADAIIVVSFQDAPTAAVDAVDAALGGAVGDMREQKEFTGKFAQRPVVRTLGNLGAPRVLLLGLGDAELLDSYRLHNAFVFAGQDLRGAGVKSVAVHVDGDALLDALRRSHGDGIAAADVARSIATGLLLGNWRGDIDKTENDLAPQPGIDTVRISGIADGAAVEAALREATVLAEATNQVRTWVTMPSNDLTPTKLAAAATSFFEGTGLEVEVLDKAELTERGMGALLGVAKGSDEPPVMICVRWDNGRPDGPRLGLVGKGITFDTGGISIKPAGGMESMKFDMGGGAAVLGAMWAIARLGVRANVIGIVPATENMPGGHAYKPGDVLKSRLGKTIEVINTDAEGRIILADGLAQAQEMGATHLVDVATLTGAVVVALGHATAGLMGSDRRLLDLVRSAASHAGDRFTELPIPPEYDVVLKSEIADVRNVGSGRQAGSIAAGIFLREFTNNLPWAHLDIAGTVWNEQGDLTAVPSGPSGTPVRTFVALAKAFAEP